VTYDPNYPPQYAPQPPRRGMSTGKKVALGCGIPALVILVFAGGCMALVGGAAHEVDKAAKSDAKEDARAAREDIKITTCKITHDKFLGSEVRARVNITNNGKKRANYLVEGEFLDSKGNKVGELLATVNNLKPGTVSNRDFTGAFTSEDLKGVTKGTCSIVTVSRDEWSAAN
jgi:hypothetical protein